MQTDQKPCSNDANIFKRAATLSFDTESKKIFLDGREVKDVLSYNLRGKAGELSILTLELIVNI